MTVDDLKIVRRALGMPDPKHFVTRRYAPHQRCGLCQEPFEQGERTTFLDDEKVHHDCAEAAA